MAHLPEEELVATDWETEFFSEPEPEKIFSSPGTLQSLPREIRTLFSTLVKDLISLALIEKKGALEGLFVFPRLILPNNMRCRTVVVVSPPEHWVIQKRNAQRNCGTCLMLSSGMAPLAQEREQRH